MRNFSKCELELNLVVAKLREMNQFCDRHKEFEVYKTCVEYDENGIEFWLKDPKGGNLENKVLSAIVAGSLYIRFYYEDKGKGNQAIFRVWA